MEKIVFNIDPFSFTTSAFLVGMLLLHELSSSELDSVGNWLQLVGLTMQTYASQKTTLNNEIIKEEESDIEIVKKAIRKIEEELERFSQKKND